MKIRIFTPLIVTLGLIFSTSVLAEEYLIDTKGSHASIQFKVSHLGYSFVVGRFNDFTGKFSYDEKDPSKATVEVTIDTASVDSNHAERDKHVRSADFLLVSDFPQAKFVSTSYEDLGNNKGRLIGDLTLLGVTKSITIAVTQIGAGKDPWGGYRRGFEGTVKFAMKDFGIKMDLGPASYEVELSLIVEGVRI